MNVGVRCARRKSVEFLARFTVIAHAPLSHTKQNYGKQKNAVTWVDVQNPMSTSSHDYA